MKNSFFLFLLPLVTWAQVTTPEPHEVMAYYQDLNTTYPANTRLWDFGSADNGKPLKVFVIGNDLPNSLSAFQKSNRTVWLVVNGIHPGESCGVDASMAYAKNVLNAKREGWEDVVLAVIPIYNLGGAENRSCCTRANQIGPKDQGFRGNARLLDLNRDMIKLDSRNAKSLVNLIQVLDPDVFLDTHTTDGADYPYAMTLISTQSDKLGPLANYQAVFDERLYAGMKNRKNPMVPYVNVFGADPAAGWVFFSEGPRFTTGYMAQRQCLAYVSEAHMLHSYAERVKATKDLLEVMGETIGRHAKEILAMRKKALELQSQQKRFALEWTADSTKPENLDMNLYHVEYESSPITAAPYVVYNRKKTTSKSVVVYPHYAATSYAEVPSSYLVPGAWPEVIERLQLNGVALIPLEKDTTFKANVFRITNHATASAPYEGHFYWKEIAGQWLEEEVVGRKGDYLVRTDQTQRRFLVEVLEPTAPDSYLRWNFFDEIFQQKEWFSDYLFEPYALEMLESDAALEAEFSIWKTKHPDAGKWEQLTWLYQRSPFYEKSHLRYPVYRLEH